MMFRALVWTSLLGSLFAGGLVAEPQPHYLDLYRDGVRAAQRQDWPVAAETLRLASFGFLDEPDRLTECWLRLALSYHALDQREEFDDLFGRIVEVDDRFESYRRLDPSEPLRLAFEEASAVRIPEATLLDHAVFAPLARRKIELSLLARPAKDRVAELDRRIAAEPEIVQWKILAVEAAIENRDFERAATLAEQARLQATSPQDHSWAQCLNGEALAWNGDCTTALTLLEACPSSNQEPRFARARLGCYSDLDLDEEARAFAASLPPDVAAQPEIRRLRPRDLKTESAADVAGEEIALEEPGTTEAAAEQEAAAPKTGGAADPEPITPAAAPQIPRLNESERMKLDRAIEMAAAAKTQEELEAPFDIAREVANARSEVEAPQRVTAQIAYRLRRWPEVVQYFRRAGGPAADQPAEQFYFAVALYETGALAEAQQVLKGCIGNLQQSPFVETYRQRILGPAT